MYEQENDMSLGSGFERSSKNKDLCEENSGVDSGFLSGPQDLDSGLDLHLPETREEPEKKQTDTIMDSGAIVDSLNNLSLEQPKRNFIAGSNRPKEPDDSWKKWYRSDDNGDTGLHLAIINEIPSLVRKFIRLAPHPCLLDLKNDDDQAPIHLAVLTRQADAIRHLLISGAKASIRDGDGNTALHLACINDDLISVDALLNPITAAELKESNQFKRNNAPQHFSIDLEQRNFYGEYCVHIAAQRNQIDILNLLFQKGADIDAREGRAVYTPLHIAVENKNLKLAKFLLEHHRKVNTEVLNFRQITAYQLACEIEQIEMIKLLEGHGCVVISPPESDYDSDSDESDDYD